jgi:hypothetical protein
VARVPAEGVGHGEQADSLSGRRSIDDQAIEVALGGLFVDMQQADDLVHAGKCRELVGDHPVYPFTDDKA